MRAMSYRSISLAARTGVPGAEASLIRLFFSELVQRIDVLAMDIAVRRRSEDPRARGHRELSRRLSRRPSAAARRTSSGTSSATASSGCRADAMDLTLGPEQESVRDAIRGMLADRLPIARIRRTAGGRRRRVARAGDLGWFTLGLPESAGGAGCGLPEEMCSSSSSAARSRPGPWLGTLLAAHALGGATGVRRVAVVDDPPTASGETRGSAGTADAVGGRGRRATASHLGGTRVRQVAADARGLTSRRPSIDPTRPLARLRFDGVAAEEVHADAGALRARGTVLVAAEAVGSRSARSRRRSPTRRSGSSSAGRSARSRP
jgi:hypothetical protein